MSATTCRISRRCGISWRARWRRVPIALLLTSATPHNGDPRSFAELIRLLDPTAIVDPTKIEPKDIEHLYVRRHKQHPEVAPEIGENWADRGETEQIRIAPTPEEAAVFDELRNTWLYPAGGSAPTSGKGSTLFPWTLLKAALSSHRALAQTLAERRKSLQRSAPETGLTDKQQVEDAALERLEELTQAVEAADHKSKLDRLVDELQQVGVGKRSPTRVVIFSERIATLDWLAEELPGRLGLNGDKQIAVLHGAMTDLRQMDVIEDFARAVRRAGVVDGRHGVGGCEPAPPVPSDGAFRSAVVVDHDRAAQRPYRPVRAASPSRDPCLDGGGG